MAGRGTICGHPGAGRCLGWVALLWLLAAADVQAQGASSDADSSALARAERLYAEESYDAVLGLLSSYLAEERTPAQEQASYRLIIRSYLEKEQLLDAKHAAIKLLSLHPGYEPDPIEDPPAYVALVRLVREQLQVPAVGAVDPQEKNSRARKSWFRSTKGLAIVGSGLLVTGVTFLVTMAGGRSGGESGEPLPGPPALPN